jgi:hypothetical protein
MSGTAKKVVDFPAKQGESNERAHIKRWGRSELFSKGYLPLPNLFLHYYAQLNPPLNSGQAMFVLQVMEHKWDAKLPYPSYRTIAKRMGISDKMARTHARDLKTMKYLSIRPRIASTNRFDFTPLFDALAVHAATHAKKTQKERAESEALEMETR